VHHDPHHHHHSIVLPPVRTLLGRGAKTLVETTVVPLALFAVTRHMAGVGTAALVGLGWAVLLTARHIASTRKVPGIVLIALCLATARAAATVTTGSAFVYFLQPTLGTFLLAGVFAASVPLRRPLAAKLAEDFCALPPHVLKRPGLRRFFMRISLLWAIVQLINGSLSLALMFSGHIDTLVLAKSIATPMIVGVGIVISCLMFRKTTRVEGVPVIVRWREAAAA